MNYDVDTQLDLYVQAALGKKAENIVVLNVRDLTSIAEFFIICSGRSNRQVCAIADYIERFFKKKGIRPLSVEGKGNGHWVLIDYGSVIMHIFYEETRHFYDLEGLWVDAQRITTASLTSQQQTNMQSFDCEEIIVE